MPEDYDAVEMHTENYLYITNGENEPLKNKAVYFLRTDSQGGKLDLTITDNKVLFGEIDKNPLHQVKLVMNNVFEHFIMNMEDSEWGECDDEQKKDFLNCFQKFNNEMVGGLN